MPTVMTIWSEPRRYTHCDHNCFESQKGGDDCQCLCGGMNHGVGYEQALKNTREHWQEWLRTWKTHSDVYDVEMALNYSVNTKSARQIARMLNRYFLVQDIVVVDVNLERHVVMRKSRNTTYRRWEWVVKFNNGSRLVYPHLRMFKEFVRGEHGALQLPMFPEGAS